MDGAGLVHPAHVYQIRCRVDLHSFRQHFSQVCAVRFILGIFEAGMLPGIAYYMSRWYRRAELTYRLSLYIVMAPLAGAFGGLLASAILTLDRVGKFSSWEMIFGKLIHYLPRSSPPKLKENSHRGHHTRRTFRYCTR